MKILRLALLMLVLVLCVDAQEQRGMKRVDTTNTAVTPIMITTKAKLERKGADYALLFGTDEYAEWTQLANPVNDARSISKTLTDLYGFKTEIVENATVEQIILKLQEYNSRTYGENDQVFVFFAGHGYFHELTRQGYLVAKDSKVPKNDPSNRSMLQHSYIREVVDNIPSKHILLMMDVCFGGTIDRSIASRGEDDFSAAEVADMIDYKLQFKTRRYVTSADKQYVADGVPGHNSPFASRVLAALRSGGGRENFVDINKLVTYMSGLKPTPMDGKLSNGDEPGSNFFFIRKAKLNAVTLALRTNVPTAEIYLDNSFVGRGAYEGEVESGRRMVRVRGDGYREVEKMIDVAEGSGANITITLDRASGKLMIAATPADAEISIDGNLAGTGKFVGDVPVGKRMVKVSKEGFKEIEKGILIGDQPVNAQITLVPILTSLRLVTVPAGARVELDGDYKGTTPLTIADVGYGKRTVRLVRKDHVDERFTMDISSDSPINQTISLRQTPDFRARILYSAAFSSKRTWAWSTSGVAAAAAGAGVFFHLQAVKAYDDYNTAVLPAVINQRWDTYQQKVMTRNIALGAAGVFAAWSVYHWLTGPSYDEILREVKAEDSALMIMPTTDGVLVGIAFRW